MIQYNPSEIKEFMQAYYNVLIASNLAVYGKDELSSVRESVRSGRQVPEELRDGQFMTGLSKLEKLLPYIKYDEFGFDELQRDSSPRVFVSD